MSSAGGTAAARRLDAARATQIADGIASGTDAGVRAVLDVAPSQQLEPDAVAGMAAMGRLSIDVGSFHDNGDGTATATATTPAGAGQPAGAWALLLVAKNGQWLLSQADPR